MAGSISNEFRNTPVLKTTIWKIASYNQGNFALRKLFDCNLEGIRFTVQRNKHRSVHARRTEFKPYRISDQVRLTWFAVLLFPIFVLFHTLSGKASSLESCLVASRQWQSYWPGFLHSSWVGHCLHHWHRWLEIPRSHRYPRPLAPVLPAPKYHSFRPRKLCRAS